MALFTFHLLEASLRTTARSLLSPPAAARVHGLQHAECFTTMRLGAPVVSPSRMQLRRLAMVARWDDEAAVDAFLATPRGAVWAAGWHVRLDYLRRWGSVEALGPLPARDGRAAPDEPVVALTLARLKLPQIFRFIRWGRPVEEQVRDDPGVTLALAAGRLPRTVSTFTIWRSRAAMEAMVHRHGDDGAAERHAAAMVERARKPFHHEFTTLRFRCLAEHGAWEGRTGIVPTTAHPDVASAADARETHDGSTGPPAEPSSDDQ